MSAPNTTVEALMHSLRMRGEVALAEPDCQRRLGDLSTAQLSDVLDRLVRLRPKYPAISDELLLLIGEQLS